MVVSDLPPAAGGGGTPRPRRRPDPERFTRLKRSLSATAADASAVAETPAPAFDVSPPGPVTAFEGLANTDNVSLASFSVAPSDANLSVGPGHVFEVVNIAGRITNKSGGAVSTFTLRSFFQVDDGADETDPRVVFDAQSQRWFATLLQFSDTTHRSSVILAVSAGSDPTGTFCRFRLGNPTFETFIADFPQLATDDQKVIVTFDAFTFADPEQFLGAGYYALNKAALVQTASSGCAGPPVPAVRVPPNVNRFGVYPAQSLSGTGRLYLAMSGDGSDDPSTVLSLFAVDGQPGVTALTETATALPIRTWSIPPDAEQAGSAVKLATNDASVITAVWRRGSLWVGGNEECFPGGARRSCLRLIQVQTDHSIVQQDVTFGAAGQYFYFPALSVDGAANLVVVFNASSASDFAGVRVTGRRATDPPNTLAPATVLRAGGGAQTDPGGRMGDYHGAAPDPADPARVWVVAEYIKTTASRNWGTFVAALAFPLVAPPSLALTLNAPTFHTGQQLVVNVSAAAPGPLVVDVYFGLLLPPGMGPALGCPLDDAVAFAGGSASNLVIRCLSRSTSTWPRLAAGTPLPGGLPASLVPGTWPAAPAGVYVVFMAFTAPGALLHGTLEPGDILALATVTLTFTP